MSTRNAARNVRQRKLNTKQPLRIVHEDEVQEYIDEDGQRHIPQVETGVEKGEEIEYHLQAVINAANAATATAGAKPKASYIPTPEASKARNVQYDKLYPRTFSQPATYIRFSSTVEDSIGFPYCMDDDDVAVLARLNDGKDFEGRERSNKLEQCSEDTFEEVISFFEDVSQRNQPFANIDNAPILELQDMEQSVDENVSTLARQWLKTIYPYWASRKGNRALMPTIKVKVIETASEADDADPYVCFRRREVRQTRKTRGRDAQVVEKLKKLRLELESARSLVQMVLQRETLNKDQLEIGRKVFEQRGQLKKVKIEKNIVAEKGEDEELLINQKPIVKVKPRISVVDSRPGPTIRIRTGSDRQTADGELVELESLKNDARASVQHQIQNRKAQHKKWNLNWEDATWPPLVPYEEAFNRATGWAFMEHPREGYPTPPPTLPSEGSQKEDADMLDAPAPLSPRKESSPDPEIMIESMPGAFPRSPHISTQTLDKPLCRLRTGRSRRWYLEIAKPSFPRIHSGVISDPDDYSDDELDGQATVPPFHTVSDELIFNYRCSLNRSAARTEVVASERRSSGNVEHGTKATHQQASAG